MTSEIGCQEVDFVTGYGLHVGQIPTLSSKFAGDDILNVATAVKARRRAECERQTVISEVEFARIHLTSSFRATGNRQGKDEKGILQVTEKRQEGFFGCRNSTRLEIRVNLADALHGRRMPNELPDKRSQGNQVRDVVPLGHVAEKNGVDIALQQANPVSLVFKGLSFRKSPNPEICVELGTQCRAFSTGGQILRSALLIPMIAWAFPGMDAMALSRRIKGGNGALTASPNFCRMISTI